MIRTSALLWLGLFLAGCGSPPILDEIALEKYKQANRLFEQGRFADCIERYEYVIRWRDRILDAYDRLATCYEKGNAEEKAVLTLERLLRVDPTNVGGIRRLAKLYFHRGMIAQAIELYRRLLELRPDDEEARAELEKLETLK